MVPEDRRTCPSCGSPVGRSRDGRPGRTEGFCPTCRNPFSFTPKLQAGDVVGGQYVVAGAIAHGGLGWIYAARDRNVSDRWVVLKGLLNSGDPDALAAAIAERQFLAQVEHPLIVEIYNFVTHEGAGYIVMEYVGGTSLKQLLKDRMQAAGGAYDPLPVDQAIAFVIEVLPAFQYLHDLNLVYCDFKPDNLIQVGDAVKLIDLGGVRRARRPRLRDLRDDGLPGAGGAAGRPLRRLGHLHDRARPDRARAWSSAATRAPTSRSLPPVDRDAAVPEARLAVPAAAQGVRAGPGRPLRLGGRAARAAPRGAARGRGPRARGRGRALDVVPALRRARRSPTTPRLAGPARAARRRRRPAGCLAAHRQHRRPGAAPGRPGGRAGAQSRGAARHGARRAGGRAARPGRRRGGEPARGRPLGVARGLDVAASSPSRAGRRREAQARSTRSTARCRASSRPSWRSRSPARSAASPTSPSRSTSSVPAPTPTTSRRRRSAWPGSGPARGDLDGARSGARPGARDQPLLHARPAPAGPALLAGSGGGLPVARRRPRQHRRPHDRPGRPVPLPGRGARAPPWTWSSRTGADPTVVDRRAARAEPRPARRARGGVPRAGRARREPRGADRLVDRANGVRRWTLR